MDANKSTQQEDRIANSLFQKTILITGGLGFIGKALVEKILRRCEAKTIYLFIREKNDVSPKERLRKVLQNQIFNTVREQKGAHVFDKLKIITCDIAGENLKLSQKDESELIENVEFVYHCAASIRFDDSMKDAVFLNTRGTKYMIALAQKMKKLQFFMHLSTAYCYLFDSLKEQVYEPSCNPHEVIKNAETMTEEELSNYEKSITQGYPNTYTFSKMLSEGLVNEVLDELPAVIVRPSIIINSLEDPIAGWSDNMNGPAGLFVGAGKGVIRTMCCDENSYADFVPVDVVASGILLITWSFLTNLIPNQKVYHITQSNEKRLTWKQALDVCRDIVEHELPFNRILWYPGGSLKKSRFLHNVALVFTQLLPAIIVDTLLVLIGQKPFLWRVQKRVIKGYTMLEYFANKQWNFDNECAKVARANLNSLELERYRCSADNVDIRAYMKDTILFIRRYMLHEKDEWIPFARKVMTIMYFVDKLTKLFLCYLVFNLIFKLFQLKFV